MKTLTRLAFILLIAALDGFVAPTANAAPSFGITTSSTTTSTTTFVVSGTAALATGTNPMWFEVRSGSSTGPLIDFGAFAAAAAWQFEVRHLQTGSNIVTVFAGTSGNVATASINLTFVLDNPTTPSVRPRPRGTEVWWGGVSLMDQTVLNPNDWQYVQKNQDGFFIVGWIAGTAYEDSVAQQLVALMTGSNALNAPAARFWCEKSYHPSMTWGGFNLVASDVTWLQRMQADGFIVSEITSDWSADLETYCQRHPEWPSNDILAWNTGDASVATPGGAYLTSGLFNMGWSSFLNGCYAACPHTKIGQTSSPAGWRWKDPSGNVYPAYAWDTYLMDPLLDSVEGSQPGNTIYVNGQPTSFAWTQDQLWACDLNLANGMPDSFHQYYAFATDFTYLYTTGTTITGTVAFPPYAAAAARKKVIAYEAWLHSQGVRHTRICQSGETLPDLNQQDLYTENACLTMMQQHQLQGGRADRYLFESWTDNVPSKVTPETTVGTFTHMVRTALKYIKGINDDGSYEQLQMSVSGSSGGQTVIQITNNGDVACLPAITVVESGTTNFTTQYYAADGSDATAAALSTEGYVPSALLEPGASTTLTITAVPATGAPANATRTFAIEAYWNPQDPTGYVRDRRSVTLGAVQANSGNVKARNTNALNRTTSWTGGAVPGLNDVAQWTSTVTTANTVSLGANLSWGGVSIVNPGGNVTINSGNTLTLYAAGVNLSQSTRNLTFNNAVTLGASQAWNVAAGRSIQVSGTLTGGSGAVLTKSGSGILTLASAVNFPGVLSLASGTVSITTTNASLGGLSGAAGAILQSGGGTLTIGSNGVATSFGGSITGASSLVKSGSGTLTLTGSSSYTGGTTVSSGTLELGDGFALGTGTASVTNNATLLLSGSTPLALQISGSGTVIKSGSGTFTKAAGVAETYPGLLVTGGTFAVNSGTLSITTTSYIQGGVLQITGGMVSNTTCTLYIGASGDGVLNVSGGTLNIGTVNFATVGDGRGTLNISGSGSVIISELQMSNNGPGVVNLNGGTLMTNTMRSMHHECAFWFNGGVLKPNTTPITPWLTNSVGVVGIQNGGAIIDTNGKNVIIGTNIIAAPGSTGGFTKQGLGSLTLSCPSDHAGATTVLSGSLILSSTASIAASGTIDVRASAALDVSAQSGSFTTLPAQTLMGGGKVIGGVTILGVDCPGNSPGIQTFTSGTTTFGPASHLSWELVANSSATPGTNYDQVVASALVFQPGAVLDIVLTGSGSAVDFTNAFWSSTQSWTVASCAATTGTPYINSVTTDSGGRNSNAYGWFSIANTAAGIVLTWNPGALTTTVNVSAAVGSLSETDAPAGVFTITRSGSSGDQIVYYSMSGSATSGTDYASLNGSVTIPDGQSSVTVTLTPIDNNRVDGSRTATLTIISGGNYMIGSQASATATLTDNEQRFSWNNASTSGTLSWSGTANWNASTPATSGSVGTVEFFVGQALNSGTVKINSDTANPFQLNVLTLSGTGSTSGITGVTLTGGTLQLVANAGYAPVVNLDAMKGVNALAFNYTVSNPILLSATTTIQGQGNVAFTFSGVLSGTGGLIKTGSSSTLTLSANNTFTGAVTVNAGTLYLNTASTLPAGANVTVNPGGQLSINGAGTYSFGTLNLSGTGNGLFGGFGGALFNPGPSWVDTFPGPIVLSGSVVKIGSSGATPTFNLNGPISGNSSLILWAHGGASTHITTWVLGGTSSFTGTTLVDASSNCNAVLKLSGGNDRLPTSTVLTLNANYNFVTNWSYVNFDLNGCNQALAGLVSTGTGTASVINTGTTAATLTINASSNTTFSGILGGTGSNTNLNIVKTGTGAWVLSGSNTYTGTTTVPSGTLTLTGTLANNIPNTTTINIQSSATLDVTGMTTGLTLNSNQVLTGAGLVSGTVTVTGTHQPGNGIGTGTFTGSLTYDSTAHLVWALNGNTVSGAGTNYDQVASAGTVSGNSGAVIDVILNGAGSAVDFTDAFWDSTQTWTVISASSVSGAFALGTVTADHNSVNSTAYGSFTVQQTATSVTLVWTPLPFWAGGTGLTTTVWDGRIDLDWNPTANASGYNVKRSTSLSGTYTVVGNNISTPYFGDAGLTDGTTYYYKISAVNSAGESGDSAVVSATPAASSGSTTWVRIKNTGTGKYLSESLDRKVIYEQYPGWSDPTAQWAISNIGNGQYRIQNRFTGHYMNIQNQLGWVECATGTLGWTSAKWQMVFASDYSYRLQNALQPTCYMNETGLLGYAQCSAVPSTDTSSWWSFETVRGATVPWIAYEAENATYQGTLIGPGVTEGTPEAECSNRMGVKLSNTGDYVQFTAKAAANGVVVRLSIPDAPTGGGIDSTLDLWVSGTFAQAIPVTSKYSWVYGNYINKTWSNDPSAGTPRHMFDEAQVLLSSTIPAGATVKLIKSATNSAAYYTIDFVELEQVPAPLTMPTNGSYLSIADYGALADGTTDCAPAILSAYNAAKSAGKGMWIPQGTFLESSRLYNISAIKINGAGMWYSKLLGLPSSGTTSGVGFACTNNVQLSDFAIFGQSTNRNDGSQGVNGSTGSNTVFQNLWIEHATVGMWLGTGNKSYPPNGLVINNCRVRNTFADGINLNCGATNATVNNCTIRSTGDDGLALFSSTDQTLVPDNNNTLGNCTVQMPWFAKGIAVYGGSNNVVQNCEVYDTLSGAGLMIDQGFSAVQFAPTTTVQNLNLYRCGGTFTYWSGTSGAIITDANTGSFNAPINLWDIDIYNASYSGIQVQCENGWSQAGLNFDGINIKGAGNYGIYATSTAFGSGTFNAVSVFNSGSSAWLNSSGTNYNIIYGSGNNAWGTGDIGTVSLSGSAAYLGGTYTVAGSGTSLLSGSDSCQYVSQSLMGDRAIIARVVSLQNTNVWAQAGVMIRETLSPSASMAGVAVTSGTGVLTQWRATTGGTCGNVQTNGLSAPYWVKLARSGSNFTSYSSPDGVTWVQQGASQAIAMSGSAYAGLSVSSHNNSALCSATFDSVNILPGPEWSSSDIGAPQVAGFTDYSGGVLMVNASGADIDGTADQFRYVYQPASWDCDITVRVNNVSSTDLWAKAGVMIRKTLDAGSAHVSFLATPNNGVLFTQRDTAGGTSTLLAQNTALSTPCWMRLTRVGNVFTAYTSPDGSAWTALGSTTINMGTSLYIGIPAVNHNPTALGSATVDNITVHAGLPAASPKTQMVAVGASATFTASTSGTGPFTFQWQRLPGGSATWSNLSNGGAYNGVTSATLGISGVASAMNGDQFRCVITDPNGSATSSAATLTTSQNVPAMPPAMRWALALALCALALRVLSRNTRATQ